jgi:GLPGLI family protein
MKNILLKSILAILLIITTNISAQSFQGKAVYQTKTSLDMDFSGSGIPADRIKMIKQRMKSRLENTYVLTFNKTASVYKKEEKLDQTSGRGGMRMMMFGGGASGSYYKNIQTKTATKSTEFSGKKFLIKDSLTTYNWKMEQETKRIGQNLCFKATTVIERPVRNSSFRFGRREANKEEEKKEDPNIKTMEQIIVTAWYTLDIPVSNGPDNYWGLPGLILELNDGRTHMLCTKIIMNPKEKTEIVEPKKGKVVSQKEYDKIIKDKMKEMRERFRNNRKKSGGGMHSRMGG